MSRSEKENTLGADGASKGDFLVGFERRNKGLKLIALSDIGMGSHGRKWCNDTPVKLVRSPKAGSSAYAHHIETFLGEEFDPALKLHDSVLKLFNEDLIREGKKKQQNLHFLNGHGFRVEKTDSSEDVSIVSSSAVSDYFEKSKKSGNGTRLPIATR